MKIKTLSASGFLLLMATALGSFVSAADGEKIRIMAANITSGNKQSYDAGHGIRIFQGLKPDVVLIQEFNYKEGTNEQIREFVDLAFGKEFHYCREIEDPKQAFPIPNGVISRFPIKNCGEWNDQSVPNRDFSFAQIDIPGEKDLWAISVHLYTKPVGQVQAAKDLVELIKQNIDKDFKADYIALGGDFNTKSAVADPIQILKEVVAEETSPSDLQGNGNTNAGRRYPYDRVLVDADLAPLQVPVVFKKPNPDPNGLPVIALSKDNGLVFDSRTFEDLSLVAPIESGDSGAMNMQHMAVIKDFLIPVKSLKGSH